MTQPFPQGVNVRKSGQPYKASEIGLQIESRVKKGMNVEAVQIGKDAWGWREVVDEGPKTGGKKQRAAVEKELAAVQHQGYDAMRDKAEAMIDAGQDVDVVYDVLAGMEEKEAAPVQEAPKVEEKPAPSKEPWQMTKAEFAAYNREMEMSARADAVRRYEDEIARLEFGDRPTSELEAVTWKDRPARIAQLKGMIEDIKGRGAPNKNYDFFHKLEVDKALAAGKEVPGNVRAEYAPKASRWDIFPVIDDKGTRHVGDISQATADEINSLGFKTKPSRAVLRQENVDYIEKQHGDQLKPEDIALIQETVANPSEVLPNIPTHEGPGRADRILLVKQNGKAHVAIVEVSANEADNTVFNFWKMGKKAAEGYLRKYREEKVKRQSDLGGRPHESSIAISTPEEVEPPVGLSGGQVDAASGKDITTPAPGRKTPDLLPLKSQKSNTAKEVYRLLEKSGLKGVVPTQDWFETKLGSVTVQSQHQSVTIYDSLGDTIRFYFADGQIVISSLKSVNTDGTAKRFDVDRHLNLGAAVQVVKNLGEFMGREKYATPKQEAPQVEEKPAPAVKTNEPWNMNRRDYLQWMDSDSGQKWLETNLPKLPPGKRTQSKVVQWAKDNGHTPQEVVDRASAPKPQAAEDAKPQEQAAPAQKPFASPEEIPYQLGYDAHRNTSHTPDVRAKQEQEEYARLLNGIHERLAKKIVPEQQEQFDREMARFKEGYLTRTKALLSARSGLASAYITGPAKFPTRRMEKRNDSFQKKVEEFDAWKKKAINAIERDLGIGAQSTAIRSDDSEAGTKLQEKIAELEKAQEYMKNVNKEYARTKGEVDAMNVSDKAKAAVRKWKENKRDWEEDRPFPKFMISNNNANINRLKKRVGEVAVQQAKPSEEKSFPGGTIVNNADIGRTQIVFDAKPSAEVITDLKANGFRWAPSEGVWQRQRTNAAEYAAEKIVRKHFGDVGEKEQPLFSRAKRDAAVDLDREVPVVEITPQLGGRNAKMLARGEGVVEILRRVFSGGHPRNGKGEITVTISSDDLPVTISRNNIRHAINTSEQRHGTATGLVHLEAVVNLPELVKSAHRAKFRADEKGQAGVAAMLRYVTPMRLNGEDYSVLFTVKQYDGSNDVELTGVNKVHDLRVPKRMPGPGVEPGKPMPNGMRAPVSDGERQEFSTMGKSSRADTYTVRQLISGVKDGRGNLINPDAGEAAGILLKREAPEDFRPANPLNRKTLDATVAALHKAASGAAATITYSDHAEARRHNPKVYIPNDAKAFYLNGEVHMIASMFSTKREVAESWVHEQLRHHGFRAFLGKDYRATMRQAWVNRDVRAKALELFREGYTDLKVFDKDGNIRRDAELDDIIHAADEAIAHLADGGWKSGVMDRIVAAIRRALRRAGVGLDFSNAEIRDMISAAAQQVVDGKRKSLAGQVRGALAPAFQRVRHNPQTETPEFKKWFGDSKVVDKDGKPLVVYHGTPGEEFYVFDKSKGGTGPITGNPIAKYGFWFSPREDYTCPKKVKGFPSRPPPSITREAARRNPFTKIERSAVRGAPIAQGANLPRLGNFRKGRSPIIPSPEPLALTRAEVARRQSDLGGRPHESSIAPTSSVEEGSPVGLSGGQVDANESIICVSQGVNALCGSSSKLAMNSLDFLMISRTSARSASPPRCNGRASRRSYCPWARGPAHPLPGHLPGHRAQTRSPARARKL